jgi:hypothetical protein
MHIMQLVAVLQPSALTVRIWFVRVANVLAFIRNIGTEHNAITFKL